MRLYKQLGLVLYTLLLSLPTYAFSLVTFHSVEQGREAIIDETFEPYFSRLQPMEIQAKTAGKVTKDKLGKMRWQARKVYQQAVMPFTEEDKATLTWYTKHYSRILKKLYPLLAKTSWKFVKLDNYIEGALPHTRGDTIVLHPAMLKRLTQARQIQGERALQGAGTVLVHELVHVAQRKNVNAFHNLYTQWGFRKIKPDLNNTWLQQHQLINPDGVNIEWIYPVNNNGTQHWILPIVTWSEGNALKHMPTDFRMRAVSMQKSNGKWEVMTGNDQRPIMKALASQQALLRAFPRVHGLYHPNEIAAEMIVSMIIFDNFVEHSTLESRIVKAWKNVFAPVQQTLSK